MASKYWIKLYHEILHDKKMARLPDNLWRRCIELFLLAGEYDDDGQLPDTEDIAWELRLDESELLAELEQLETLGIVQRNVADMQRNVAGWLVKRFKDRQSAASSTERGQQRRARLKRDDLNNRQKQPKNAHSETKRKRKGNEGATNMQRNVAPDTDTDTDINNISANALQAPQDDKKPTVDKPKTMLMGEFQEVTGLKMPRKKSDIGFWWSNIGEILHIADGDVERGKTIIRGAVEKLKADGLTIGGPESIVKTCRNIAASNNGSINGANGRSMVIG